MMKAVLALALSTASAFVTTSPQSAAPVLNGAKEDLVSLAESNTDALGSAIGFWDPLGASDLDFFGLELSGRLPAGATIGYLRHAEIKHGRVAMAAFLGYCFQSLPLIAGDHILKPYSGYVSGVTPQEQWDNVPAIGKLQILVLVGMLESYGEGAGSPEGYVHYCAGGLPGYFPPISGKAGFGQVGFNLYDPFNWFPETSPEQKARGRQVEINNGRLAMLGIFSLLSESAAPGAVPPLTLLNYIVEATGITNVEIPLPLSAVPLAGLDDYTLKLIGSFPSYDPSATQNAANAWGQFDVFASLPYWNK